MFRPSSQVLITMAWLFVALVFPVRAQEAPEASPEPGPLLTSWVELHGHRYTVEIAQTDEQRALGLMFRSQLGRDHGMLFIHDTEGPLAYWMKNTLIPLDIFYFDAGRRLVSVSRNTPPCELGDACPPFRSEGPALYVLELNAGNADRLRVKKGDRIRFGPHIPSQPAPVRP